MRTALNKQFAYSAGSNMFFSSTQMEGGEEIAGTAGAPGSAPAAPPKTGGT